MAADGQGPLLEKRLEEFSKEGLSYPLEPGFYKHFPTRLLRFDTNARRGFADLKHVDRLGTSIDGAGGVFTIPIVDEYGQAPDGLHRTLALLSKNSDSVPVLVREGLEGSRVSAASDAQRKYPEMELILDGYYEAFLGGVPIEEIAAVANKSKGQVRDHLKFVSQASDAVLHAIYNSTVEGFSISHGIALSSLPHQEQDFFLSNMARGISGYTPSSVSEHVKKRKNILSRMDDVELPIFKADPQLHKRRSVISGDDYENIVLAEHKRIGNGKNSEIGFDLLAADKSSSTRVQRKHESKLDFLSKMYLCGMLSSQTLSNYDTKMSQSEIHCSLDALGSLDSHNSLESLILSHANENPLEINVCSVDEALEKIVSNREEESRNIELSFGAEFAFKNVDELYGARKNARGEVFDTIISATELIESVAEHGILQPLLLYERADGNEVLCGNRRYWASRMAEHYITSDSREEFVTSFIDSLTTQEIRKAGGKGKLRKALMYESNYIDFDEKATPSEDREIPALVIPKGKLKRGDRARLQIAENSQKPFSLIERMHLYNRVYTELKDSGKDHESAIRSIAHSTRYSRNQVERYIKYWETIPQEISTGFSQGLINYEMFDALADIQDSKIIPVAAKSLLEGRKSRKDILEFGSESYSKTQKGTTCELFTKQEVSRSLEDSLVDSLRSYILG